MLKNTCLFLLFVLFAYNVFSEDVIISNPQDIYPDSYVKITYIDPQSGKILDTRDTNIIADNWYFYEGQVSFGGNGNYLIAQHKEAYKLNIDSYQKVNLQIKEATPPACINMDISPDESIVLEKRYDDETKETQLIFHGAETKTIITKYSIASYPRILMNADASVLLYNSSSGLVHIIERDNDAFTDTSTSIISGIDHTHLSYDGKRVIYMKFINEGNYKLSYMDRLDNGWSEPIEISIKDREGKEFVFRQALPVLHDITSDGKKILFYMNGYLPAIIQEENGVWSEPEILDFEWCRELGERDRYRLSGDGNIIAAQDTVEVRGGVTPYADVYILTKSPDGKWNQQKINPDGTLVIPDIFLTDDGSKLFWLPEVKSSVSNAKNY